MAGQTVEVTAAEQYIVASIVQNLLNSCGPTATVRIDTPGQDLEKTISKILCQIRSKVRVRRGFDLRAAGLFVDLGQSHAVGH